MKLTMVKESRRGRGDVVPPCKPGGAHRPKKDKLKCACFTQDFPANADHPVFAPEA